MRHQFPARVTRSAECSDRGRLPGYRIADCNGKNKSDNHNQNIEQHTAHRLVRSHIIRRKMNGRVRIFRNIILNLRIRDNHLRQQGFHKIIRQIFFCRLIRRFCHIVPRIIIVHLLVQARKSVFRHHRHIEFQRIKHQIRTFFMQCGIIDIGDQSDDTIRLSLDRYGISHRNADIVRVHAVHHNLIGRCREASFHQTCQIDLVRLFENADIPVRDAVAVVIFLFIPVKIFK